MYCFYLLVGNVFDYRIT
uniref:Uncharacterized protein n=1 Tax=Anguilla anguilla TaxID=7936 RepID=A0A0E9USX6_ANGAN